MANDVDGADCFSSAYAVHTNFMKVLVDGLRQWKYLPILAFNAVAKFLLPPAKDLEFFDRMPVQN